MADDSICLSHLILYGQVVCAPRLTKQHSQLTLLTQTVIRSWRTELL